jgi:hypothetical protein
MKRPKLGKFSLVSLRDLLAASLPTILLVLAACAWPTSWSTRRRRAT